MTTGAAATERLNASTLLDRVLDAGRADRVALVTDSGVVTYGDLARTTAAVAAYMKDLGVAPEQRVLMVLDDSPAFHATFLAVMRIGAVPVPVNPMDRVDNHVYYLQDSYAKVVVIEAALQASLEAMLAARPEVQVLVAGAEAGPHPSLEAVLTEQAAGGELPPPADTHRDDMAFWLYSSGSTGRPKGVVHTHQAIGVTVDTYARRVLRIGPSDVCYSTTKLYHAYGLGNSLSFPLSVGAGAVLVRGRAAPERIFEIVERHRPTLFFSVPALYAAMIKAHGAKVDGEAGAGPAAGVGRSARADFSSVRACVSAAEALPAAILSRWQDMTGLPILDGIGSTEMLHIYCSNTLEDLTPGSSGRPVPGYALRVVDENGRDVGPEESGDMLVRGDSCAAFYWHQQEKTKHCMRGEWFYTGDRYLATSDQHFVYQGRADDMIKVGGLWVSPADVEACLARHPAVSEAAVIGTQIDDLSRIKAFVISREPPPNADALAEELRAWCKEHLRRYEYPHVVAFVDDFPRTATGKIQRYKLREAEVARVGMLEARTAGAVSGASPN
jgi:benzoate-CoA ligase family protein